MKVCKNDKNSIKINKKTQPSLQGGFSFFLKKEKSTKESRQKENIFLGFFSVLCKISAVAYYVFRISFFEDDDYFSVLFAPS